MSASLSRHRPTTPVTTSKYYVPFVHIIPKNRIYDSPGNMKMSWIMTNDKDLTACRTCGTSRWKVDNKTKKVYENIPAKAWRTIDEKFPKIAEDTRNLRLGISADGVDVNTGNKHHSVWPVLTVIYNLPPWLCMKRKFINLSVLISGYPGNDIDVFLEPLVDDLHTLFEIGVDTYDASIKDNFNLCAVVLWIINDYPALGTLCGCPYSGFKVRYLPYNHAVSESKRRHLMDKQNSRRLPIPMTGNIYTHETTKKITEQMCVRVRKQKEYTTEEEGIQASKRTRTVWYWKKFNIWYQKLKYWRHNPVPHCIDFMHVEKNVAESIVGTLLHVPGKMKDGLNARLDLAELGVKPELFAMQEETKHTTFTEIIDISSDSSDDRRWAAKKQVL
ncbi:putative transposon, En/Spm-like protein [Tanacetum coccineum]|uniref:Transposon, En/Spm-like protein n=1 Tax=Tanacetum coccineum TaxID=301880 RepID=A0ABQ5FB45_9ASTR